MALVLNGSNNTIAGLAVGGLPDGSVDADSLAPNAAGFEVDQWRLTTSFTGDADPVTGNLERVDDASFTKIGNGMSEASGAWTFPSTGIWKVEWNIGLRYNGSSRWNDITTLFTSNNGGAWDEVARAVHGLAQVDSTDTYTSAHSQCIVDITDVSQCKVKFKIDTEEGSEQVQGNTSKNLTYWTFTRVGDT